MTRAILLDRMRAFEASAGSRLFPVVRFVAIAAASVAASLAAAYVLMSPSSDLLLAPFVLAMVLVVALMLTPTAFLVFSFIAFATLQVISEYAVSVGPAVVYGSDMIVGIVLLRGILPRDRVGNPNTLSRFTTVAFAAWVGLMVVAAARGLDGETTFDTVVRLGMAVIYWPLLYFGFARTFRERDFDINRFFGALCLVGVALVGYMLTMRALGRPFEPPDQIGRLGEVVASTGTIYRRDFGFWSAFVVYPAIALLAIGRLVYERERALTWLSVAVVCVSATFLTLIRAEIFGLIAGTVAVVVLSGRFRGVSRVVEARRSAVVALAAALIAVGAVVTLLDPGFATVVSERTAGPFAAQSAEARSNLDFRVEALRVGRRTASEHVLGLGLLSPREQFRNGIDPSYLAHSAYATMLVYIGWPGLVIGLLAILGLLVDSARAPGARAWLHPVFAGVFVLLLVYSFGASGIVGEEHVMGLGALFLAARFSLVSSPEAE